jgi:hypothetical protein
MPIPFYDDMIGEPELMYCEFCNMCEIERGVSIKHVHGDYRYKGTEQYTLVDKELCDECFYDNYES